MKKRVLVDRTEIGSLVTTEINRIGSQSPSAIRIGISGGRSASYVVKGILELPKEILNRITLYVVDERLSGQTNESTLMHVGLSEAFESMLLTREQLILPQLGKPYLSDGESFDIVFLGVGEDGHIASLFPGSYPDLDAVSCTELACINNSPKPPNDRITITYRGFRKWAKNASICLLFLGEGKRIALRRFLDGSELPSTLPSLFFLREWFSVTVITDLLQEER